MPTIEVARRWYSSPENSQPFDPVHGFDHVLRVYSMAERLALSEGADLEIVCAAALLHDVHNFEQPSIQDQYVDDIEEGNRLDHHHSAAEFSQHVLKSEGWSEERIAAVQHCIRSHRFREVSEKPQTLEAKVLFDADKLDAIGAIGVARAIAYAARASQPAYAEPSGQFLVTGAKEENEDHSAFHEYLFKLVKLKERLYTQTARLLAEERHRYMVEFFERLELEMKGER